MKRALLLLVPSMLLTACSGLDFSLVSAQDALTLAAISGEEEDWAEGKGDFLGETAESMDVERPPLFRECDARGDFEAMVARFDTDGDGQVQDRECDRGEGAPPQGEPPEGEPPEGEPSADAGAPPQGEPPADGGTERGGPGGDRAAHDLAALLLVYDVDADGELSDTERETLLDDFTARCEAIHARLVEDFDADGDGELSEEEMTAAADAIHALREEARAEMEAQGEPPERGADPLAAEFDTDGDGELSEAELEVLREAMRERIRSGEPMGGMHM
ncbi:MAG: EF-hand domain-containing protein [Alphaproteobacteria bacterium]|nr:EF-hand domain-containing protein [Alphaproteobacteria bacterium]